jgi:hypothetical protein
MEAMGESRPLAGRTGTRRDTGTRPAAAICRRRRHPHHTRVDGGRIGGVGVKIQPDFSYANFYHWLLGDTHFYKGFVGVPMPIIGRPYFESPDEP